MSCKNLKMELFWPNLSFIKPKEQQRQKTVHFIPWVCKIFILKRDA
jgi:hypothetical protein